MKTLSRILSVIFAVAIMSVLGAGCYFAFKGLVKQSAHLSPQGAAVITFAAVITLSAALIIAGSIRQISAQRQTQQLRMEQASTYQLFIDLWANLLRYGYPSDERRAARLSEEFRQLECWLALYGSSTVIKAHTALRALERKSGAQHPDLRTQFVVAALEMRKELREDRRRLTAEELEQLLLAESDGTRTSDRENAYQDLQLHVSLASNS